MTLALLGWGVGSARQVLYPERHDAVPPHELQQGPRALARGAPRPSYARTILTAHDGVSFDVWWLETPSPRARLLIYHGYYADRDQVLDLADGLRARGYEVVLVELRGHGSRPGPCTLGVRETEEAGVVLRWAAGRDPSLAALPVGVLGFSMGGAVACQVASRCPQIRAVVTDSVYSRFFPVLAQAIRQRYHLPAVPWAVVTWWSLQLALGARLSSMDPVALARRMSIPLFAVQGGEDRRVAPRLAEEFFRQWAGPKEQWFEPDVAHVQMFARHPQEYVDRVAAFFDRVLVRMVSS